MLLEFTSIFVYSFLLILFLLITFNQIVINRKKNVYFINNASRFLVFLLIFFAGFRYKTGTDFDSYLGIWSGIKPIYYFFNSNFGYASLEPGFLFFVSILRTISTSEILFFFSLSTISIIPVYLGLKKINLYFIIPGLFFYFLIFYIPYVFNGMRQAVAMGLYVYSFYFIINHNTRKLILISLVAISFHSTGIIILLSYFIYNLKIPFKIFIFIGFILTVLLKLFVGLHFVFQKLGLNIYYLEDLDRTTTLFQVVTRFLVLLLLIIFYKLFVYNTNYGIVYRNFLKVYLIGFFFYLYFFELNTFATRINMFFRILEILLFSLTLYSAKNISNKLYVFLTLSFIGIYIFISALSNTDNIYHFNIFK